MKRKRSRQRQSTLSAFLGSSSPARQHDRTMRAQDYGPESDDSSDPSRIKFEAGRRDVGRGIIQGTGNDPCPATDSSRSTSSEREIFYPRKSSTHGRNKRLLIVSDESDEERKGKTRRLAKGKEPEISSKRSEDENLADVIDQDGILTSRLRARSKKSIYVRNLERLQRRRRGEATSSENDDSGDSGAESSFSQRDATHVFEDAYPSRNDTAENAKHISSNEDEEDFIVDDEGEGEIPELPVMFSMGTYQDLSHHFKVICQFFVHLAVKKPRKRRNFIEDEMKKNYFSVPLTIMRRKLSAMKDSLVTSSIWKSEVKAPLESFPDFRLEALDFSVPYCDACHIGGRVATLRGIIGGRKYDHLTFEVLREDEMVAGDEISGEIEWNLGRFCAARAQVFHLFSHWEYALYQSLRNEVENFQEAIADQTSHVPPDDPNDADTIMEWLDAHDVINVQWGVVKNMMDRARRLEGRKQAEEDIDVF